ncbi:threonine ammonia-lyase, biosynthetic [Bordetella genomosp. 1]|uniref:L-threonine dehydratase n=1 Tax=Bordetella genomosp. 1 TaxID=1395607 RepID=A0ABX4EZU3_9BORD|nr:threonine ammonia-lyase, biosynthetic [Bordetella genomosp. 1]OZI65266.1 threonine ammonia-lyase, biosynthetic [Bordetella genomosp. 1]
MYDTAEEPATRPAADPVDLAAHYARKTLNAPVYDVAIQTPLSPAPRLSRQLGCEVLLKREDLQPVYSFKLRGAYNRVMQLSPAERARGVIAASAGNHAQGLALAAKKLGIEATIVMPRTAPELKVQGVLSHGARALLHGDAFPEALAHAQALAREQGLVFIPPYDDPDVIAGQGTVAMEILRQHPGRVDAIFVPVGGGSLAAGVAAYVKHVRPEVKVIAVEPADSNCLQAAMAAGERVVLERVGAFADGVAVAQVGAYTFEVCRRYVDDVILVSADEICAAIKDIYDDTRSITEPAGALAVAGLRRYAQSRDASGQVLVAIDSGANINFDRLRHVTERATLGEQREALIAVTIPEQPGSFRAFCEALGSRQITEFNYRYHAGADAQIFVGVQTHPERDPRDRLVAGLRDKGFAVLDLTDNELAKLHVRHMVGGRADRIEDERVYRFEFPERPGALFDFLSKLGGRWNITMFHYRNHGAAEGRAVAGLQVPADELARLPAVLDAVGYPYWDETDNPAYRLFIR